MIFFVYERAEVTTPSDENYVPNTVTVVTILIVNENSAIL